MEQHHFWGVKARAATQCGSGSKPDVQHTVGRVSKKKQAVTVSGVGVASK
jgi:hypothetical protein